MSVTPDAQENRAAELGSSILPSADWRVVAVTALPNYRLSVRFVDGTSGHVDMRELIQSSAAGVFKALRDPDVFERVGLSLGAVIWPGEIDIAPDAMYDEIKAHGEWVLR